MVGVQATMVSGRRVSGASCRGSRRMMSEVRGKAIRAGRSTRAYRSLAVKAQSGGQSSSAAAAALGLLLATSGLAQAADYDATPPTATAEKPGMLEMMRQGGPGKNFPA